MFAEEMQEQCMLNFFYLGAVCSRSFSVFALISIPIFRVITVPETLQRSLYVSYLMGLTYMWPVMRLCNCKFFQKL